MKGGHMYIMSSLNNRVLYIGVTSSLARRITRHRIQFYGTKSFSAKYHCVKLVYYRWFDTIVEAIQEEKRLKAGSRKQKVDLINAMNPEWEDLSGRARLL
jgi:putative endonuclease